MNLKTGTRVRTVKGPESDDWNTESDAYANRRFGVSGEICAEHDAHGECYSVRHADGSIGCYDPWELIPYRNLTIKATEPNKDIWLADDEGNLVQKETGEMKTSVLAGRYMVHFGLGSKGIEINLCEDREIIQG